MSLACRAERSLEDALERHAQQQQPSPRGSSGGDTSEGGADENSPPARQAPGKRDGRHMQGPGGTAGLQERMRPKELRGNSSVDGEVLMQLLGAGGEQP